MFNLSGEILILSGGPGSGKTTAARALATQPGSIKVHLHADDFWHFIKHGSIPPYLPEAHEQNGVVVSILAKVAASYAEAGYFVILDGIVGPWFISPFLKLSVPVHYLVLRPNVDMAIERCRSRGGDTLADPIAIAGLHQQLSSLGDFERHALSTGCDNREEVLEKVTGATTGGSYRLIPG